MLSTQPRSAPRGFTRFLLPSIADLIFLAILVSLSSSALAPRLLGDAGIGWHIRNGELMLQTHAITRVDPFSSTMGGKTWYAWEWLYDLVIARIYQWMGLNGVVFFAALIIALTLGLVFRLAVSRGTNLPLAVVLVLLAAGASAIHWFARPHVLSWLFTVIWFHLLDSWETAMGPAKDRTLLWLPLLMLFWANIHAGFVTGFVLLGIYLASELIQRIVLQRKAAGKRLKWLAGVTGLSLLASLVNPYGYQLPVHVYEYLSNRWLMNHIEEFQSPNFHGAAEQCFAILLLITIGALALAPMRPRISHLLVILFAAGSGLYASRSLPVSAILLVLVAGPILSEAGTALAARQSLATGWQRLALRYESFAVRTRNVELGLRSHLWPVLAVLLMAWPLSAGGRLGSWQVMDAHFDSRHFPIEAVNWLAHTGNQQPVFAPDFWGGYLIYRLYPQTKVVVDDRHDLYGPEFFKLYLNTVRGEKGWDDLLRQKQVRIVLAPAASPLASLLQQAPAWKTSYADGVAVIFERSSYP
jgi:hypothetical protein